MRQTMATRLPSLALAAALFCGLPAAAFARGDLVNVPLQWTPTMTMSEMGAIDISGPLLTTPIHIDAFTDTRSNPALVAENREDPAKPRPMTTSTNVAGFVTDHVRDSLRGAGLSLSDAPDAVHVSGEIRQFFVTETDNYRGEVQMLVHVRSASGKELWTGIVNGGAENFGRSYRADNYCETISTMTLRATYNMIANPAFREALVKH